MTTVFAFVLGVLLWTLTEYLAHRFLGHHKKTKPNPFADEHTRHHSVGDYFAPAYKKAFVAIIAFVLVGVPAIALAGKTVGAGFALGFALMYITYEAMHRRDHTHAGWSPRMRRLRRHHFYHHFADPRMNHGVTTTLWDRIFSTYVVAEKIRVPHKLAMGWLFESDAARRAGIIAERFAAHYTLVGAPAGADSRADGVVATSPALALVARSFCEAPLVQE